MQSKRASLIEAVVNVLIGFFISLFANFILLPSHGCYLTPGAQVRLTLVFTVISIVRSYFIRRWFNARLHRWASQF